jgi:hypothetical protein
MSDEGSISLEINIVESVQDESASQEHPIEKNDDEEEEEESDELEI